MDETGYVLLNDSYLKIDEALIYTITLAYAVQKFNDVGENGFDNIDDKIVKMLGVVALTESTMKRYRDKYCLVADLVFSMLNEIEL